MIPVDKSKRRYFLEVALWGLLLLVAMELFVRFFVVKSAFLESDPYWGVKPVGGLCAFQGREGFATTCYEANNEVSTPFHDGRSVVVLGDSYTEAIQMNNSGKYVSLVEVDLRKRGLTVDLHNLGDSNRTIADPIYLAPFIMSTFAPEIVVVQTNESALFDTLNPRRSNYFEAQADGGLKLVHHDLTEDNLPRQNLILSSGLATFVSIRWKKTAGGFFASGQEYVEPPHASLEQVQMEIAQLIAAYPNSKIVILIIPSVPIITPAGLEWANPQDAKILNALKGMDGITVVYPGPAFRQLYKNNNVFPRGFINTQPNYGHLNQFGHDAVAASLSKALELLLK